MQNNIIEADINKYYALLIYSYPKFYNTLGITSFIGLLYFLKSNSFGEE